MYCIHKLIINCCRSSGDRVATKRLKFGVVRSMNEYAEFPAQGRRIDYKLNIDSKG